MIAVDAAPEIVDGGAFRAAGLDATASYGVVEVVSVAVRAVEIVLPLEAPSGRDRVVGARQREAQRDGECD